MEAEGVQFKLTNYLDIDEDGNIYFTDTSSRYNRGSFLQAIFAGDPSGRLLEYNPVTKVTIVTPQTSVPQWLTRSMADLSCCSARACELGQSSSFLFLAKIMILDSQLLHQYIFLESIEVQVNQILAEGGKAGRSELFATLRGAPDDVRRQIPGGNSVFVHRLSTFLAYI